MSAGRETRELAELNRAVLGNMASHVVSTPSLSAAETIDKTIQSSDTDFT